jgi:hypothetical protein
VAATPTEDAARLSNRLTFFHKLVFPTLWLAGWGAVTVVFAPERGLFLPFAAAWIVAALLLRATSLRLKTVVATRDGLVVGNFRREVLVPYEQIADVRENKLVGGRLVTVELRSEGAFGSRFVFVPYTAFVVFADHPAAIFIKMRVRAAAGR